MNCKVMTLVGITVIISILSGCLDSREKDPIAVKPAYYDEKASYLILDSINQIRDDAQVLKENPSLLSERSQNYYNEVDKLIVSPAMQPAVDEFKKSMKYFNKAANLYDYARMECTLTSSDATSVELFNLCIKGQQGVIDETAQLLTNGTAAYENSIKLLPRKNT